MVQTNNRLIDQVLAAGPQKAFDVDNLAQRITLDVIGQVWLAACSCRNMGLCSCSNGIAQQHLLPC